jgi:uncharacterized protein (TIGR02611 family)
VTTGEQPSQAKPHYEERDIPVLLDATDDDWAWRRAIRANPVTARIYRVGVFVLGAALVIVGLMLVPLPGPGWLIVFLGIAVLASEFERAQQLKDWGVVRLQRWNAWVKRQPMVVQGLIGLLTAAFVVVIVYAVLRVSGVPAFLPDSLEEWLHDSLRL